MKLKSGNRNLYLCKNLKFLRDYHKFTQQYMADILNVDRSTYSYYEQNRIEPSISTLILLSEILGVKVDSLLKEDINKNPKAYIKK